MGLKVLLVFGNYEKTCHEHFYTYVLVHVSMCTAGCIFWSSTAVTSVSLFSLLDIVMCSRVYISSYILTSR